MSKLRTFLKHRWMLSDHQLYKRGRFNAYIYFFLGTLGVLSPIVILTLMKDKFHAIVEDRHKEAEFLRNLDIPEHTVCLEKVAYHIDHSSRLLDLQSPMFAGATFAVGISSLYLGYAVLKLHKLIKEKEDLNIKNQ